MPSLRRSAALALMLALPVLPAAAPAAPATGEPYEINVILALTGPGAFIGQTHQKELLALQDVVNRDNGVQGRPLKFVFADDQTNPQVSVQLTNAILQKKPAVVLGSILGALCKATQPLYVNGPVNYCLSPVITPEKNGYVFSASVGGSDLIVASLRYLRGRGWKRIATLNTTDASGQIADGDIANALKLPELRDVTLVATEHFNPGDTSVTAQIAKIKAAGPQAMIVWSPGTPFGTAMHGLADVGLDVPVLTSSANMVSNQLKSYNAFLPKQLYFQGVAYVAGVPPHTRDQKPVQTFAAALKAAGIPQDLQGGIAWDPAMIVVDALRKLGPNATAAELRTYLENLHGYTGITGVYDFRGGNQRGLSVDDALIMRWDGQQSDFVAVSKYGGAPV